MLRLHTRVGQLSAAGANLLSARGCKISFNHGFNLPRNFLAAQQVCLNSTAAPVDKNNRHVQSEINPISKLMVANRGGLFSRFIKFSAVCCVKDCD